MHLHRSAGLSTAARRAARPFIIALSASSLFALAGCREEAASAVAPPAIERTDKRILFHGASVPQIDLPAGESRPISSVLNIASPMRFGEFVWDDEGIPPGKLWVLVDLGAQTIAVFRGSHEIGTAVMLYGAEEKPTPIGSFTVRERRKDHWSRTYDAPMPYMLRLTDDGVAIHGSTVIPGSATHGCLGLPLDFAKRLFNAARVGDEVIIARNARELAKPGPSASAART